MATDFLRATAGIGVLLAGAGVFYHYVVALPQERQETRERAAREEQRTAEEQRQRATAAALEQQQRETAKVKARQDLEDCLGRAEDDYVLSWAKHCSSRSPSAARALKACTQNVIPAGTAGMYCADATACSLPTAVAENVERFRAQEKEDCYKKQKFE